MTVVCIAIHQGSNSPTCLCGASMHADLKIAKRQSIHQCLFMGTLRVKAARKVLAKWTSDILSKPIYIFFLGGRGAGGAGIEGVD